MSIVIDKIASFSIYPAGRAVESFFEIKADFIPGFKGQYSSKPLEIMRRVAHAVSALFAALVAIATAPIALMFHTISHLMKKDYIFEKKLSVQAQQTLPKTLTVASFNIAFLPNAITKRNGIKTSSSRCNQIIRAVSEKDPDILLLQEAFRESSTKKLAKKLENYSYKVYQVAPKWFGLNSGLAIFSKYPLSQINFQKHPLLGGACKWSSKGVLTAKVQLSTNHFARIYTTHFNGGAPEYDEGGETPRNFQMEALQNLIQKNRAEEESSLEIVGGDFNFSSHDVSEWKKHNSFFRSDLWFQEEKAEQIFSTVFDKRDLSMGFSEGIEKWKVEPNRKIDYIIYKSKFYRQNSLESSRAYGASDHLMLCSSFILKKINPS